MRQWELVSDPRAEKELDDLDGSLKPQVSRVIERVLLNPLPQSEGGYGKPLGNKNSSKLAGCLKIKLKKSGVRVVYRLIREGDIMKIIVISVRDDDEVYKEAERRL